MGDIGEERRRIEVLPASPQPSVPEPATSPAQPTTSPAPAEPVTEPAH